ncbi:MAG: tetratricopeptide repeat protein [bacterium]|nr:MAG: tetratricopeptide repeat protein [bacterium]
MKYLDNIKSSLTAIEKYTIYISLFLFPLLFFPFFENAFELPKLLLGVLSVVILVLLKITKSIIKGSVEFNSSKLDFAVIVFMVAILLSGLFSSANKVDAFLLPGTASFVLIAGIYYFLINQISKKDKNNLVNVILASGLTVSTIQIASFLGITNLIPQLPEVIKLQFFNPLGSTLNLIVFLIALLPILIKKAFNKTDISEKILSLIVSVVFLISISTSIYLILPNRQTTPKILDFKTGWSVAIDSLKISPLLGSGPGNYLQAFNQFRPVAFNLSPNWNLKYTQSTSSLLTLFTETGILGFVTLLTLMYLAFRKPEFENSLFVSLAILSLGFISLPLSMSILPLLFLFLALSAEVKDGKVAFFVKRYAIVLLVTPIIFILIGASYLFGRAYYAELLFNKTIKEIGNSQGVMAFELINKAVKINPYSDKYHQLSAGINLALAENIARKEDLTDQDKETISQLIQQSIVEGKAAVSIGPNKSSNWDALSNIYQTIISFAQGADTFAIQTLTQAISLDPTNPILRIRLGGLYHSLGDYERAIEVFKLAVLAKPDYANSYYNLAISYKEAGQTEKARENIQIVLNLLGKDDLNYETALKELEKIESLTQPESLPEPIIEPQVELPPQE